MSISSPRLQTPSIAPLRIGFALSPGDPFWVQVREAVKQRAQELGVDLIRMARISGDIYGEKSLGLLEDLRVSEVRSLISHTPPDALLRSILDGGLPVICAEEASLTHPLLVSVRGLDRAAELSANSLANRLGGSGNLLLAGGLDDQLATTRTRLVGFHATMRRYPHIRCVHFPTEWEYGDVYAHLTEEADALRALFPGGRIDAIFGLSDPVALASAEVCRKLGLADATTLVAGVNGDPLAIAAIVSGTMHCTVETSPLELGFRLAEYAVRAASGKPLPDHFDYRLELVTAENASHVAARKLVDIADLPSRLVNVNRRQEEERVRQLQAGIEMNRSLGALVEWKNLSHVLAGIICTRYGYDHVQVLRWSDQEQCLILASEDEALPVYVRLGDAGILASALLRNQAVYVPDTQSSQRFRPDPAWPETRARVVLPIRYGGKTMGLLDLHSRQRTVRSQPELDALQMLADQLASAIENALLYARALAAKAEAEESNRMRARLLANLSYGLRSPLNVILGYTQSALEEPNPYGVELHRDLIQDLHLIQQSAADLNRLINELLDLAQAESGALPLYPERIEPNAFLGDLFHSAADTLGSASEVQWQLQLPASLPALYADPLRLRTILLTLLSNAARYTTVGTVRLGAMADTITDDLHIWIEDTGVGIAPTLLENLNGAAPFDAADAGGHAPIGLGLGIARHLVRLMRGRLEMRSGANQGTLCKLTLPLHATADASPATASAPPPYPARPTYQLTQDRATALVRQGTAYMESHFGAPFGRDDLAHVLGVSPSYVSRIFQRELGLSPWEYLTRLRVEHARTLLLDEEYLPVGAVALRVGFNDPAYFARIFRRYTGKSPVAYRALGAADEIARNSDNTSLPG